VVPVIICLKRLKLEYLRTFIALEIKEDIKKMLVAVQQKIGAETDGIKWVKPKNMHLTLKFIGPTREDKTDDISNTIENIAGSLNSFTASVSGFGAFPNRNNPKVIWAGLKADEVLFKLQTDIDVSLEPLGFVRGKRPFSPHLTIGRVRDSRAKKKLRDVFENIKVDTNSFEAGSITFYKSDLMPDGPVYTVLKSIQF